jgi:Secretion system C-terminal sorting domain
MNIKLQLLILLFSINFFSQSNENRFTNTTLLIDETFGFGSNTITDGISSAYCFNSQQLPSTCFGTQLSLEDNQYVVTSAINPNNGAWFAFRDHTTNGLNPDGRFLAINIGGAAGPNGILFSKKIYNAIPEQDIIIEAYAGNLLRANLIGFVDPGLTFEITTSTGILLAQQPLLPAMDLILRSNTWQLRTATLNIGSVTTPYLVFNIRSSNINYGGNDVVIDDIKAYQMQPLKKQESVFEKVAIYPNPANDILNIDNVLIQKVSFYNNLGSLVKIFNTDKKLNNKIDLINIPKGIYLLKLENQQESIIKKMVIE